MITTGNTIWAVTAAGTWHRQAAGLVQPSASLATEAPASAKLAVVRLLSQEINAQTFRRRELHAVQVNRPRQHSNYTAVLADWQSQDTTSWRSLSGLMPVALTEAVLQPVQQILQQAVVRALGLGLECGSSSSSSRDKLLKVAFLAWHILVSDLASKVHIINLRRHRLRLLGETTMETGGRTFSKANLNTFHSSNTTRTVVPFKIKRVS